MKHVEMSYMVQQKLKWMVENNVCWRYEENDMMANICKRLGLFQEAF